jgi:DNA-binding transcriptional MerR regulator
MNKKYSAKAFGENINRSIHTLQRWRNQGTGPAYIKVQNGGVLYDERDIEEWLDSLKVSSTSESSVKQAQNQIHLDRSND